jgi:hypothetical protein
LKLRCSLKNQFSIHKITREERERGEYIKWLKFAPLSFVNKKYVVRVHESVTSEVENMYLCFYYTSSTLYRYANVNFRNGIVFMVFVKVRYTFLIFEPKRDEVTGEWNKLHNEELHILYSSPNIIGQINSRRMTWAGHVARMGSRGKFTWFWWESPNERDHLEDQGADGRMGSDCILWRLAGGGACRVDPVGSG